MADSSANGKRAVDDNYTHESGASDAETSRKKFKSEPSDRLEGLNLDTSAQGLFRCLMKTGDAGAIIGKGGSNINRLRKEYNVTVTVPNSMTVERVLTMKGRIQDVGDCLYDCFYLIHEDKSSERGGGSSGGDFKVETRMLIHSPYIGGLIGYKGERIKEIREKTRAEIKIYEDCCPGSTERVFKIDGVTSDVVSCVMYTMHILNNTDVKTRGRHLIEYDPINSADLNDSEFRNRQVNYGPRGFSDDIDAFGFGGFHPMHDAPVFLEDAGGPVQTISLTVAAESAGAIIGTGGRNINVARRRSGAEIKVEDGKHDGAPRQVTITGSEEQINYAKFLIQQFVREDRVVRYNSGNRNQAGGGKDNHGGGGKRGGGGGGGHDRRGVSLGGGGGSGSGGNRKSGGGSSNNSGSNLGGGVSGSTGSSNRRGGGSSSSTTTSFPAATFVTPQSAATATLPVPHDPNAYAAYSAAYYAAAAVGVPPMTAGTQPQGGATVAQPHPPTVSGFYQQPANVATASASPATSQLAMAASQYAAAAVANSQPPNAATGPQAAAAAFMPTMAAAYGAVYTPMAPPSDSTIPQAPTQNPHTALYPTGALSGYGYWSNPETMNPTYPFHKRQWNLLKNPETTLNRTLSLNESTDPSLRKNQLNPING